MTIRDTTLAKLQQLSEPLLQEVSDFIDFVIQKHQVKTVANTPHETLKEGWLQWFEAVDSLEIKVSEPPSDYQKLLLDKYKQQGLSL